MAGADFTKKIPRKKKPVSRFLNRIQVNDGEDRTPKVPVEVFENILDDHVKFKAD